MIAAKGYVLKTPLIEYIEEKRAEVMKKLEKRPYYDNLSHRSLEKIRRREERRELKRTKRIDRKKTREEFTRGKKSTIIEEEEEEYEYYDDQPRTERVSYKSFQYYCHVQKL